MHARPPAAQPFLSSGARHTHVVAEVHGRAPPVPGPHLDGGPCVLRANPGAALDAHPADPDAVLHADYSRSHTKTRCCNPGCTHNHSRSRTRARRTPSRAHTPVMHKPRRESSHYQKKSQMIPLPLRWPFPRQLTELSIV